MTEMKSLSILGDRTIEVVERERPSPARGEVLVRVAVSAICGSEMRDFRQGGHANKGNVGHEAAGVVVELGDGVDGLAVGDRVGVSAVVGCGVCSECAAGRYTWCHDRVFVSEMHAEYFVIAARACHRLPDDIDWATGVLISGDGLGVPFHSLSKFPAGQVDTVAVFGLGPVGLGAVLLQTFLGRAVIGVDLADERLELAKALGASSVVQAGKGIDAPALVRSLTGGKGADVCIEAAGSPITAKDCFAAVRTGGTVIFNGEQPSVELSPSEDFIRRDVTAAGAWFYHFSEFGAMLELARRGLDVEKLVTHRVPFDRAQEGFDAMDHGQSGKVLLVHEI